MGTIVAERSQNTDKLDFRRIILEWLKGEPRKFEGRRVIVSTYNQSSYLGAFEGLDFVRRYHVKDGEICASPLQDDPPEVQAFAHACDKVVAELKREHIVKQIHAPRQYDGAAVLFALA